MIARRFVVRGRVQGVGYRWFVIRAARGLGLAGWTRNDPDGSVEVVAQGSAEALAELTGRLEEGPRAARVTDVREEETRADPAMIDFDVKY